MHQHKADQVDLAMKEAMMLIKLRHENILGLFNVFTYRKDMVIFTQLIRGGEL
jgi:serine/threonine protein kinase